MAKRKSLVRLALILCFLLTQILSESNPPKGCMAKERTALLSLKEGFEDPRNRLKSWRGKECCAWTGVICSNKTGNVVKLDLHNTKYDALGNSDTNYALTGRLKSSLLALGHLNYLDLSLNDFNDSHIPEFIWSMSNLKHLNLSGAFFGGSISPQLGNLSNLLYLDLSENNIQSNDLSWLPHLSLLKYLDMSSVNISTISNWPQIVTMLPSIQHLDLSYSMLSKPTSTPLLSNLSNLETFDISSNFYGDVDLASLNWILNLTSLEYLDMSSNNFTDIIPGSFNNLCNIKTLIIYDNQINMDITEFTHSLPRCLWPNLQFLDLGNTNLVGNLSSILKTLTGLNGLYLANNNLSGPIPFLIRANKLTDLDLGFNSLDGIVSKDHFANLMSLQGLSLRGNSLIVDQNWIPPTALIYLQLDSCILGLKFPPWIKRLRNIVGLAISNANIIDKVPNWFWSLSSNLILLYMSNNQLSGKLDGVLQLSSLQMLFLNNNRFEGSIPELPQNLTILHLSNNSLSGTFPKNIGALNLRELLLPDNSLNCPIPTYICQMHMLEIIDLSNNLLVGPIPRCWTHINPSPSKNKNLEVLNLRNNSISDIFPSFLKKYQNIYFLDLSYNKLSGNLPSWIGKNLSHLEFLLLRSNMFTGNIPVEITMLYRLQVLDLAQNIFSGTIPSSVNAFSAITHKKNFNNYPISVSLELDVVTKGAIYGYNLLSLFMSSIDLSSNSLTGEIPDGITSLVGLINLNLSGNLLSGNIPVRIGAMQSLESLDLSNNDFTGEIPSSLSNITSLSYLNMSNNNLSGRIPSGNQLQTLDDPSTYSGNNGLCGPPLSKICPGDKISFPRENGPEKEDTLRAADALHAMSLDLGICIGFILGLWSLFCVVLFLRCFRVAYFRAIDDLYDIIYVFVVLTWARILRK